MMKINSPLSFLFTTLTLFYSLESFAIYGGKAVSGNDFDAVVSVGVDGHGFCTGTLIGAKLVLTAAHCVIDLGEGLYNDEKYFIKNPSKISISKTNGSPVDLNDSSALKIDSRVKKIRVANSYLSSGFIDAIDLAVLELATSIQYESKIRILPSDFKFNKTPNSFVAVGFGATPQGTRLQKMKANLTVSSIKNVDGAMVVSAGDSKSGICSGDSGGPLLWRQGDTFYVVGVTSLSFGSSYCSSGSGMFYYPSSSKLRGELGLGF